MSSASLRRGPAGSLEAIGVYQVEAAKSTMGRSFRVGDLSAIVMSLYGALPLPAEENPLRNLGAVTFAGRKTLVLVDSPNKLTGDATLRKAIAQRDNLMGGWDRVVVLGWNFEPSIGQSITALNDDRLEVLVIPPDLAYGPGGKGDIPPNATLTFDVEMIGLARPGQ